MDELTTLIENYRRGPEALKQSVADLSDEQIDARPFSDKWTIREVVCHIADFEIVAAERIRRVLAEDNPTMADGDPDAFARGLHYNNRCLPGELALIEATRNSTTAVLSACSIEDFQRTGVHSTDGPMTLETLIERTVSHIPHHIRFIDEKRKALAAV